MEITMEEPYYTILCLLLTGAFFIYLAAQDNSSKK
jgi:hypothetical protein